MGIQKSLLIVVSLLLATNWAIAVELRPEHAKTAWRIPSNDAVPTAIEWLLVMPSGGRRHTNLEAAIGQHHSYEIAWAYYTKMLGLDPQYPPKTRRQEVRASDGKVCAVLEDVDEKRRFTHMGGRVGKYDVSLYLWTDEKNRSEKDRVYVKITLTP